MIAFDLDGVFINDADLSKCTLTNYLEQRTTWPKPLFYPKEPFVIVTGRLKSVDTNALHSWCGAHNFHPQEIYMNPYGIGSAHIHKSEVYRSNENLTLFVESCTVQANHIRKATGKEVICFPEFITQRLGEL